MNNSSLSSRKAILALKCVRERFNDSLKILEFTRNLQFTSFVTQKMVKNY